MYLGNTNQLKAFSKQFKALYRLQDHLKKTSIFTFIEPSEINTSHFILGISEGSNLLIINPLGTTKHNDFYKAIKQIVEENGIKSVYISNTTIQRDPGSRQVSCGVICAELVRYIAGLDKPKEGAWISESVFDQIRGRWKVSQIPVGQSSWYKEVDIGEILSVSLKALTGIDTSS